jgi:hypothetical protein
LVELPARLYFVVPAAARAGLDRDGLGSLAPPLLGFESGELAREQRGEDEELWQLSCHQLAEDEQALPAGEGRWLLPTAPTSRALLLIEQAQGPVGPFYHFAPTSARESIVAQGLDYRLGERSNTPYSTRGNFLLDGQLALARIMAETWCGEDADIWTIDTNGLELRRDPSAAWRKNSWFSSEPILASRLELLESVPQRRYY